MSYSKKGESPNKLIHILSDWPTSRGQEGEAWLIDELMVELIDIGRTPKIANPEGDEAFFWQPRGEGVGPDDQWDSRTREIGKKLYQMRNGRLDYMKSVHDGVVKVLGPLAGQALSAHWHRIGDEEPKGEVWLH